MKCSEAQGHCEIERDGREEKKVGSLEDRRENGAKSHSCWIGLCWCPGTNQKSLNVLG